MFNDLDLTPEKIANILIGDMYSRVQDKTTLLNRNNSHSNSRQLVCNDLCDNLKLKISKSYRTIIPHSFRPWNLWNKHNQIGLTFGAKMLDKKILAQNEPQSNWN